MGERFIKNNYEKVYMISEYMITISRIKEINERYGGTLRNDAEIETALYLGKGKCVFKKLAYLLKAILVGHPFTDGNKRTALMVALIMLEDCEIKINDLQKVRLIAKITKIASENIVDVSRIERWIRYAVQGN